MQTATGRTRLTGVMGLLADDGPVGRSLATVVAVLAWVITWRPQVDPDVWWHLAIGRSVVATGTVPRIDPFSWMSAGHPFVAHSWAWDVVLRSVYDAAGLFGTSLLGAAVSAAIIGLLWAILRLIAPAMPPLVRAGAIAIGIVAGLPAWSPRAQLLDLALVLACTLAWSIHLRRGRVAPLAIVPLVTLLWANLHGSGILAFPACLVALAVAIPLGVRWGAWPRPSAWPLIVSSAVAVGALAINPYGLAIPFYPFDPAVASAFHPAIDEWRSPDFADIGLLTMRTLLTGGLVALALSRSARRDPLLLMLAAGWSFVMLGSVRFVLLAGPLLAAALLPASQVRRAEGTSGTATPTTPRRAPDARIPWAGTALVSLVLLLVGFLQIAPARQSTEIAGRFPVAAVDRLVAGGCAERILNAYDWGGYLAFRTGRPVGAYGSSPGDIVATDAALEALAMDPGPYLDQQGVAIALVKTGGPLARWLETADGWRPSGSDPVASLYVRASGVTCLG